MKRREFIAGLGGAVALFSFSAKWLELLKQIAPGVTRVGVLRDPGSL
jgi:hypothetical protein